MQIFGGFCLLVVFAYIIECYMRILQIFIGFLVMECASRLKFLSQGCEFGGGFVVFGCFSQVFNVLGLFLVFGLGFKVLQSTWHSKGLMQFLPEFRGKSGDLKNGFCLRDSDGEVIDSKVLSCGSDSVKMSKLVESKELVDSACEYHDGKEVESFEEDNEFDVLALTKLVRMQRQRANAALMELEKERMAAASAADEAMAMILRLQNEKSNVEIEANQYRRMAEQKQQYDQEVIQSLRWIIMKYESESRLLEDQSRSCRKRSKQCLEGDGNHEMGRSGGDDSNMSFFNSFMDEGLDDVPFSSLDYDTSV